MLRAFAEDALGVPNENVAKLTPRQERAYENVGKKMAKHRLVAEVVVD